MSGARPARGLLVGRFQPFHNGHLALVRSIRGRRPKEELVLAIGSAQEAFTAENPFTAAERFEMIARALGAAGVDGWVAVPLPDIHRHALWVAHCEELLPPFGRVYTNNPLTRLLFERAGHPVEGSELLDRERLEGRRIRAALRNGGPWAEALPPAVADYLRALDAPARLATLASGDAGTSP